jgi:hypothetical protein
MNERIVVGGTMGVVWVTLRRTLARAGRECLFYTHINGHRS